MTKIEKVLYVGKTRTSAGGRDGTSRSSDSRLDIMLSSPGSAGNGSNPGQLFAAGWSACFIGAMGLAARKLNMALRRISPSTRKSTWARRAMPISTRHA